MPSLRLSEVAALVGGELIDDRDPRISGVAGIEEAGPGDLTFVASRKNLRRLTGCKAEAVLIGPGDPSPLPAIRVEAPYPAFAKFLELFRAEDDRVFPPGVHPTAIVDPSAELAPGVAIGPYSVIGPGVKIAAGTRLGSHVSVGPDARIGHDCRLYAQAALRESVWLGDRVILHVGAIIGTDGFGYLPSPEGLKKIPQVGTVVLEDDVEIGAGVCIDRATMGRTRIGRGTKIDNLVQVAHNVQLGADCALSAQTGISGSTRIGDRVTMGGQVGIGNGLEIGSDLQIGGKSGVAQDLPDGKDYFGYPALEAVEAFRIAAAVRRLPDLLRRFGRLEKALEEKDKKQE